MQNIARFVIILSFFLNIGECRAQNWNVNLLKAINPEHPNSGYWKNTSASAFAVPALASIGTLIYGFASNSEQAKYNSYELFLSIAANSLICAGLKSGIHEDRPSEKYPNEIFDNSPAHGKSFPSGHTSLAFTTATTLSLQYHKWYVTVPAFLWASSVGYSRMYLGRHYPTDVLAGAGIGIGTGYLSHWLTGQIFKPYNLKNIPHE